MEYYRTIDCEKCGTTHWSGERCPDKYTAICDNEEYVVYAHDFIGASSEFAELYRTNYGFSDGDELTFEIEDKEGLRKKFQVSASLRIEYGIEEI